MYRNVIDIRREVPNDVLKRLVAIADKAFNNRAGKVKNVSTSPYRLIYEGGESEYGCLEVGMLNLKREYGFLNCVSAWEWVDDDPNECCDLLKLFAKNSWLNVCMRDCRETNIGREHDKNHIFDKDAKMLTREEVKQEAHWL